MNKKIVHKFVPGTIILIEITVTPRSLLDKDEILEYLGGGRRLSPSPVMIDLPISGSDYEDDEKHKYW
ncbi:hypothetical protein LguiB_005298 [Lonicera macranthoides]